MRILIVTHAPISPEFGVSQMAINLAEALRHKGHEVIVWSPLPLPQNIKWWQRVQEMRDRLDNFLKTQQPFDIIDSCATLITQTVAQSASVIVRSVQPDILYILSTLKESRMSSIKDIISLPLNYLYSLYLVFLIIQGWRRAKHILCLGSLELLWMNRWFPWWHNKLSYYVNALSLDDQVELTKIHQQRTTFSKDQIKFLWIGRWVAHKGNDTLLKFIRKWKSLRPQDTFTIAGCGDGVLKKIPLDFLQLGIVEIVPSFSRQQLYSLLANHNIGLFTSRVEGWGLSLNEMLEAGMPVFATKAGGSIDIQPFVSNLLYSFPPNLNLIYSIPQYSKLLDLYYHQFSWEEIAGNYEKLAIRLLTY